MPDPGTDGATSVRAVLAVARKKLTAAGIDTAALDARVLLGHVFGQPATWLHANPDAGLSETMLLQFDGLIGRRARYEPVAHLVGTREFWSHVFDVGPQVLVPRPDSETLIAAVLEHIPDRSRPLRILDLGTGSGCLLLTLLGEYPAASGVGVDISGAALEVAARNGRKLDMDRRAIWIEGGWDTPLDERFDLIVSNPPYIETGALAGLAPDVAAYEPNIALDGGADGLAAYRRILESLDGVLGDGGLLVFEIGSGQSEDLSVIALDTGYRRRAIHNDLSGTARALIFDRATSC